MTILVGYEVGTGTPVEIPLRNLAVTGQTQESGKTTTLEALVQRSGVTSLAFVTKRGESAFADGRRVRPYFRDRADWQFVTSILDATLQEKNKFLRPWIMKVCRTTRSLADVQQAVRKALETAKGVNEGVYTQLDAYLDLIVPEIQRARLAPSLDLEPGLNVMDVSAASTPMQMLYIQSALDFVNDELRDTVVIVPEAWEFIPEQKGSPVKAAAVTLVRKGSGIGNHIWVDSQDMAGVDKTILRGCPVWLIGVQREANEIKRNLANIPKSIKRPTAAAVAMLERGQFYVCWGSHSIKTYVQPVWMPADEAQAHARGETVTVRARRPVPIPTPIAPREDTVNESEARALREENEALRRRLDEYERRERRAESSNDRVPESAPTSGRHDSGDTGSTPVSADALYQDFKRRILAEPKVLRILAEKPELRVEVERKTIEIDGSSPRGRIARLLARGWFDEGKTQGGTRSELGRTGADVNSARISEIFGSLLKDGFLTLESGNVYRSVPGMKVNIVER